MKKRPRIERSNPKKQEFFAALRDLANELIYAGAIKMNTIPYRKARLRRGRDLIHAGADLMIIRAKLFKATADKRLRRLGG